MKKFLYTMAVLLGMAVSSQAMSYEQARQQALFLADKMAYELNLTEEQYEACYEVNLDYFMGVTSADDLYGEYWTRRNLDISYILLDWQYRAFLDASYFYRPLYWNAGYWHFGIYARYPHRDYFYFGRPAFWSTYRGDHSWHRRGGESWYHGRDFAKGGFHGNGPANGRSNRGQAFSGMRDGFNKGDYGRGTDFGKNRGNDRNTNMRGQSSTRSTVGNVGTPNRSDRGTVNFGGSRDSQSGRVVSSQRSVGSGSINRGSSMSRPSGSSMGGSVSRGGGFSGGSSVSRGGGFSGGSSVSRGGGFSGGGSVSRGGFSGGGSHAGGGAASGGSHGGRR